MAFSLSPVRLQALEHELFVLNCAAAKCRSQQDTDAINGFTNELGGCCRVDAMVAHAVYAASQRRNWAFQVGSAELGEELFIISAMIQISKKRRPSSSQGTPPLAD